MNQDEWTCYANKLGLTKTQLSNVTTTSGALLTPAQVVILETLGVTSDLELFCFNGKEGQGPVVVISGCKALRVGPFESGETVWLRRLSLPGAPKEACSSFATWREMRSNDIFVFARGGRVHVQTNNIMAPFPARSRL